MKYVLSLVLILTVSVYRGGTKTTSVLHVVTDHLELLKEEEKEAPLEATPGIPSTANPVIATTPGTTTTSPLTTTTAACIESAAGIEDSSIIGDQQLNASSKYSSNYGPQSGRLHYTNHVGWLMNSKPDGTYIKGEWLQVDLLSDNKILAVATQGGYNQPSYVKTYFIETQKDGQENWDKITDDSGDTKIFNGNVDGVNTVVKNYLPQPITARFVRIIPESWENAPYLRWELYLC